MRLLYASHRFFKKITQIYGLFLNQESFFGKKTFLWIKWTFCNKKVVFSFLLLLRCTYVEVVIVFI